MSAIKQARSRLIVLGILGMLLAFVGSAQAVSVTWPAESDWVPGLDQNWEPIKDPLRDSVNTDYIDFKSVPPAEPNSNTVVSQAAFSWFYDGTNVYFRLVLDGDPVKTTGNSIGLHPFGWNAFIESTGDRYPDYTVSIDGTGNANKIHTMYNTTLDDTMDGETGHTYSAQNNGVIDGSYTYLIDGYVRISPFTDGNESGFYMDFFVPLTWFEAGGNPPTITENTRIKIAVGTGASGQTINKDLAGWNGLPATLGSYYDLAADTTPDQGAQDGFGVLREIRHDDTVDDSGTWETGETLTLSGYGWPISGSQYYQNTIDVKILAPDSNTVWTGTVSVDGDGTVGSQGTWQISGSDGVYIIQVEDPLSPGSFVQKDTFTVAAAVDLTDSSMAVDKAAAVPGDTLTYTINVVNSGGLQTTPIITSSVPTGTSYVANSTTLDGDPLADVNGGLPLVDGYTLPVLTGGATAVVTFQVAVERDRADQDVVSGSVQILDSDVDPEYNLSRQVQTTVQAPILTVSTTTNKPEGTVAPGEEITFTTTVTNGGHAEAVNVVIVETVPQHARYIEGSTLNPDGATVTYQHTDGGVWDGSDALPVVAIKWSLATVAAQSEASLSYRVVVP